MAFLQIAAFCVIAAMICAAIRPLRPEMAMAVSLAAGLAALALLCSRLEGLGGSFEALRKLMRDAGQPGAAVVKAAGIALAGELGTQLCRDAGEEALAGRIALASRVAILSLCVPMLAELLELVAGVLS